jgi:hypothetical protein
LRQPWSRHEHDARELREMASAQAQRHPCAKRVADQNDSILKAVYEVLLDQIGVVGCTPVRGRRRRFAEPWKIDQMNSIAGLKKRAYAAQAVAAAAPPMEKHHVGTTRASERFVDERTATVFESLEFRCRT